MYPGLLRYLFEAAEDFPERISHRYRNGKDWVEKSYSQLAQDVRMLAAALSEIYSAGNHVSFFMNNRYEWILTDFALQSIQAVSVPRGSDTPAKEAAFIYKHSESRGLIVENVLQLKELIPEMEHQLVPFPETIIIVNPEKSETLPEEFQKRLLPMEKLFARGQELMEKDPELYDRLVSSINTEDLLTIIYTSGTTGNPKGVMLNHDNFIQNVDANAPRMQMNRKEGDVTVTLLPAWHVFERTFEYCGIQGGLTFVYSSLRFFAQDLKVFKPHILISVPRVWESIYQKLVKHIDTFSSVKRALFYFMVKVNYDYGYSLRYLKGSYLYFRRKFFPKYLFFFILHLIRTLFLFVPHLMAQGMFAPIRKNVGGRLRGAISGGGALPHYIDSFFNSVGITLLNAYGMTECAPGILSRTYRRNTIGATGTPFLRTETKLLHEDGREAVLGQKGILYVRGPQVMQGYYKNPEATREVLDDEGWLKTGDLAMQSANGDYVLVGRSKDTIVLAGGENVEPQVIEDKLKESPLIDHAVVMGQDKKGLTALLAINEDELRKLAESTKSSAETLFSREQGGRDLMAVEASVREGESNPLQEFIEREVNRLISKEEGFKPFERISKVIPVKNDFSVGKELTQSLKIKRNFIAARFHDLVQWFDNKRGGGTAADQDKASDKRKASDKGKTAKKK